MGHNIFNRTYLLISIYVYLYFLNKKSANMIFDVVDVCKLLKYLLSPN